MPKENSQNRSRIKIEKKVDRKIDKISARREEKQGHNQQLIWKKIIKIYKRKQNNNRQLLAAHGCPQYWVKRAKS